MERRGGVEERGEERRSGLEGRGEEEWRERRGGEEWRGEEWRTGPLTGAVAVLLHLPVAGRGTGRGVRR